MTAPAKLPAGYIPRLPLWQHQETALDAMSEHTAFALLMEMRTGKTATILAEFGEDELAGEISQLLIVAPAGVYRTWEIDAEKHLSHELYARTEIACWESGPTLGQQRRMENFMRYAVTPRILLVNIEALSTVKAARDLCIKYLGQAKTTMVIDESTTIKNHKAARTKFVMQIRDWAVKRRILSGLPSPQSPLDVYSQFDFLGRGLLGFTKYDRFEDRYATKGPIRGPGGRIIQVVTGHKNLDELKAKVDRLSYRVRLSECYDLPDKLYMRRDVEMTPEQVRAYAEMKAFAVARLENEERVTATIVLTQMLRLHQILAGHTTSDDGVSSDIPTNKIPEVLDILENTAGKAIIWAAYDADVRKIATAIEKVYGINTCARFWGGNRDTREHEEALFKLDPKYRFMVATAAAGGRGRTWDMADTMIYYSNTFSLEHRMQSEERNQGVGKVKNVVVFDLITHGTIEDKIVDALIAKKRLSDEITGDNWKSWIA